MPTRQLFKKPKFLLLSAAAGLTSIGLYNHHYSYQAQENIKQDELDLLKVQIITRHGARTPIGTLPNIKDEMRWNCPSFQSTINPSQKLSFNTIYEEEGVELYGNCMKGQLTVEGAQQMIDSGKELKERYLNKLFGNEAKLSDILSSMYVRSTDIRSRRTEFSAIYLLLGFLFDKESNPEQLLNKLPTIHMYEETHEIKKQFKLVHDEDQKDETLMKLRNKLESVFGMREKEKEEKEKVELHDKLLEARKIKHIDEFPQWESISNSLQCMTYHGHKIPSEITKEDIEYIETRTGNSVTKIFGNDEILKLSIGRFLTQLRNSIEQSITKNMNEEKDYRKLEIYAGHDTTLVPLLMSLNAYNKNWPPFASNIAIELYGNKNRDKYYIKLVYNNNILKLNHTEQDENGLIPYEEFAKITEKFRVNNYQEWKQFCYVPITRTKDVPDF
ncbi:hypothetical protein ABK040_014378 [Willaertia magna]